MVAAGPAFHFDHRIGRVLRPHGLAGDLVLQLFRSRKLTADHLKSRACDPPAPVELELSDERTEIHGVTRVRFAQPTTAIVHLADVDTREAAEYLLHAFVDIDPRRPPAYLTDDVDRLFGASVVDADTGEPLGEVTRFLDTAAHPLLVLSDDETKLVPFVDAFVIRVDHEAEPPVVYVRLPDGLLQVNDPKPG